jgi:hypothetical protein
MKDTKREPPRAKSAQLKRKEIKHEKKPPRAKDAQLLSSLIQLSTMLNKIA